MDVGSLGIYAGTSEERVQVVVDLILEELKRLRNNLLTEKDVVQAKELIKGNFLLSMESTDNRMIRVAMNEFFFERYIYPEDVMASIDAVSAEDVRNLACEIFTPHTITLAATGRISEKDLSFDFDN
jgi:predicted Zn-dependent peptidase